MNPYFEPNPYAVLPILISFLAGIALDMSLSRIAMDIIFIVAMVATALVLVVISRRPRKKKRLPVRRRQLKVVKSRKVSNSR